MGGVRETRPVAATNNLGRRNVQMMNAPVHAVDGDGHVQAQGRAVVSPEQRGNRRHSSIYTQVEGLPEQPLPPPHQDWFRSTRGLPR